MLACVYWEHLPVPCLGAGSRCARPGVQSDRSSEWARVQACRSVGGGDRANSQMPQHPPTPFPQAERDLVEGGGDAAAEPRSAAPGHWQGVPLPPTPLLSLLSVPPAPQSWKPPGVPR